MYLAATWVGWIEDVVCLRKGGNQKQTQKLEKPLSGCNSQFEGGVIHLISNSDPFLQRCLISFCKFCSSTFSKKEAFSSYGLDKVKVNYQAKGHFVRNYIVLLFYIIYWQYFVID